MAVRHRARIAAGAEPERRAYLGEVFLRYYPAGSDQVEILPQIIAANCLGITYGDPGPKLDPGMCRDCWGDRSVWLGNAWGVQHAGGTSSGCTHECHDGEVWLA